MTVATLALAVAACGSSKRPRGDSEAIAIASGSDPVAAGSAGSSGAPLADAGVAAAHVDAAPQRAEHTTFTLLDNRHAAHRRVSGDLVLDASDIGFARYTKLSMPAPRWKLGQTVDNQRAAVADRTAYLEIPLTVDQAASTRQLTASVHGDAGQLLEVDVNGKRASKQATVKLAAGWQTITIPIDDGRVFAGENRLALQTSGGNHNVAFTWLRVGAAHDDAAPDPRAAATFDAAGDALELEPNASLTWYVTIPDGAMLVADPLAAGCRVDVQARAGDDSFAGGFLGHDSTRVDLSPMSGKVVRLVLAARDCPRSRVVHPRITLIGPAAKPLPDAPAPKYIVLWIMDALRADRIPLFTPGARAQTPNLDELAKTSTIFRQYYVQGNESQVSHSSIWTGLYPAVHNVRDNDNSQGGTWMLGKQFDLIATKLSEAGFFTTAVTGNGFVNEDAGYGRGFKQYRNMMRETGVLNNLIYGEKIVDAAIKQFDQHRSGPTYLFLGTIDNHSPWVARKPWIDIYSPPGSYHGPFQEYGTAFDLGLSATSMGCSKIPPPADVERLRAIYDSAISYDDAQVGRMIQQLKDWGIWDQTMMIVTADHGDELFEDGRCGHGGSLRDTLERVPFLIHDPARFPGGTIVDEGAESVDILPSIVEAVGAPPAKAVQGAALEPLAQGIGRGWARPSYASMYEQGHAMRIGRWKMRVMWANSPVVNDLVDDPGEMTDVAAAKPTERRMLTDNLGMFLALRKLWKKSVWGVTTSMTTEGAAALDTLAVP
nr:sulfatase [Kofleriaceae bacterium]